MMSGVMCNLIIVLACFVLFVTLRLGTASAACMPSDSVQHMATQAT